MPILYRKINKEMKTINELTKEDAIYIVDTRPKYQFTNPESSKLLSFVREWIDPTQQSCLNCGTSMRDAKNKIIIYYDNNKLFIDNLVNDIIEVQSIIVEEPIKKRKKK